MVLVSFFCELEEKHSIQVMFTHITRVWVSGLHIVIRKPASDLLEEGERHHWSQTQQNLNSLLGDKQSALHVPRDKVPLR